MQMLKRIFAFFQFKVKKEPEKQTFYFTFCENCNQKVYGQIEKSNFCSICGNRTEIRKEVK